MNAVVMSPLTNFGWSMTAATNGRLCPIPSTSNRSSATRIASMAAARSCAPGAELGDHRIVIHADLAAFKDAGVVANAGLARRRFIVPCSRFRHRSGRDLYWRAVARQPADRWQKPAIRILRIKPVLDRPALQLHVALTETQPLPGGDADHLLHQVDAGDEFGNRMLHLKTRVHLQEIKLLFSHRR